MCDGSVAVHFIFDMFLGLYDLFPESDTLYSQLLQQSAC